MGRGKSFQRLTSVIVTVSLLSSVFLSSLAPAAADQEVARVKVGPDLTAVLSSDGVLTLEGTGRSDDFTPETAPLAPYADRVTRVVIPDAVTGLGDYLFYGCYALTGTLTLPAELLELGSGVFSGPSADQAPHFTYIFNDFTSLEEVVPASAEDSQPAEPVQIPDEAPAQDTGPGENIEPGEPVTGDAPAELFSLPQPTEDGSVPEDGFVPADTEPAPDVQPEEPPENVRPTEDETVPEGENAPEAQEGYRVSVRRQQIVGREVFYPAAQGAQAGLFLSTMDNISFLNAAVAGGYALADGEFKLYLTPGDGEGGVATLRALALDGRAVAPACPAGFTPHAQGGTFLGWLTEDGEDLYVPGDSFPVDLSSGEAALCALWSGAQATLNAQPDGPSVTFASGDGGGGTAYAPCEDGSRTYARWPEDFGFTPPATLADAPTVPAGYDKAIVFDGWVDGEGTTYDPGDLVSAGTTLTARWAWAVVGYMSKMGTTYLSTAMENLSGHSQEKGDMYRNIIVVDRADAELHGKAGWIMVPSDTYLPELACTVTSLDPVNGADHRPEALLSMDSSYLGGKYTLLSKPAIFRGITLSASHRDTMFNAGLDTSFDGLFANCHKLIMGMEVQITDGSTLNVFGGSGGSSWSFTGQTAGGDLAIFSGDYQRVYGGSFKREVQQDRSLRFIAGETDYLFGGGYQKDSTTSGNGAVYLFGGTVRKDLVAASDEGTVRGTSSLLMLGGTVTGSIYGGGNLANMTGSTSITILDGTVGGNIYGGGNQATLAGQVATDDRGQPVYTGQTAVDIRGGGIGGSVYGGGFSATATVTGATHVTVSGGSIRGSVFGGGDQAPVLSVTATDAGGQAVFLGGETTVTIEGGTVSGDVFGGSAGKERAGGEAYEEGGAAIDSRTAVTVTGAALVLGSVYGGGSNGNVGRADTGPDKVFTHVTISGGTVTGSVFGGGLKGKVGLGAITSPTEPSLTGPADPLGSTTVTMTGGTVDEDVFGGGSGVVENLTGTTGLGVVYGDCTVNISGGTVGRRVFGGSNMARITGSSSVTINSDDGPVKVTQTVYAGGNGQGVTFDEALFLVFGDSTVWVEKTAHDLSVGGSIFGSGNLTRVNGTRALTIKGPEGGKWATTLTSLQRAHTVTIQNCDLTLTGAVDKVDMTSLSFSIARVPGEVRLVNSDLHVKAELNEVRGFGSYLPGGDPDMSGGNTFTVLAGRVLRFGVTDPAANVFTYGPVKGVTDLHWERDDSLSQPETQGVFIHASYTDSDTGDPGTPGDTGAFVSDQPMEEGLGLISGKTPATLDPPGEAPPGAYSYWRLGGNNATLRAVLKLTRTEETRETVGGRTYYKDAVTFQLPTMVLQGTEFSATKVDLSGFGPLLTEPNSDAPATQDRQMLMMSTVNDTGLFDQLFSIYLTDAKGVVHQSGLRPQTAASGRPAFTAAFYYENPAKIPTGTVVVQLSAHALGEDINSSSRGLFTLELTIEGSGSGTAIGQTKAGRHYAPFDSAPPVIAPDGAVTAQVVLNYIPKYTEGNAPGHGEVPTLTLYRNDPDGAVEVADAAPTVLMVDLFTPIAPKWYSGILRDDAAASNGSVKLDRLSNVRGMAAWRAPLAGEPVTDKTLLFLLDFRDAPLAPGDYYLMLEFSSGSCVPSAAPFRVQAPTNDSALSWTDHALHITTPDDLDYQDGALIRLTGLSGNAAAQVQAADDRGAVLPLIAGDGAVFLPLPQLTQGMTAAVHWDFSAVDEHAAVTAALFPLPVFQTGGSMAPSATAQPLELTGSGDAPPAVTRRAIVATLTGGDRLVDQDVGGTLTFAVTPDQAPGDGESISVEVLKKSGSGYTGAVGGCDYTVLSGDGLTGSLTLPAGLDTGTYRVRFWLQKPGTDGAAVTLAEYFYPFIVR